MANTPPILPVRFRGPSSYGDVFPATTTIAIGTGGTNVGDTTTTSYLLPKPPCTACQLIGLRLNTLLAAVSASGTVLATVFKRSGASTDTTLTGATSLEADFVTVAQASYQVPITATSIQNLTFAAADVPRVDVVTTNTVGTQPQVALTALWAIITP